MENLLQELIVTNVFAFLLIFTRFGTVVMLMPGIGDGFVPPKSRLLFTLAMCFIITPILSSNLPPIPTSTMALILLIMSEAFIGLFIGIVMRLMISALSVAGSIASVQAGLSNAMLFDPTSNAQGSIIGAIYSSLGVTLILVTDMHHFMLSSAINSYMLMPATDGFPDIASTTEVIVNVINIAFKVGVQIALPFIIVVTLMQIGLGLLGRLMPQMQIFFVAMPVQIFLTLLLLSITISSGIVFWLHSYEAILYDTLAP